MNKINVDLNFFFTFRHIIFKLNILIIGKSKLIKGVCNFGYYVIIFHFMYPNVLKANNFINPIDSIKIKKDTNSLISIAQTCIRYNFSLAPNYNYGSEIPRYIQRIEILPVINIAGFKISSNFDLSSEDFSQGRNLNRINLSFDKNSFKKVFNRINQNTQKDNILKKIDSLNNLLDENTRILNGLNEQLDNKDYLDKLESAKAIKARSISDSNYSKNNNERILQAEAFINNYENKLSGKNKISGLLDSLAGLRKSYTFISNLNKESSETFIRKESGKIGVIKNKSSFLKDLAYPSKLEVFDVSPNWSPLILSGITLRGGLVEFSSKKFMLGFTGGFVNSINWYENVFNKNSYIYSGRIGYGNSESTSLIFTYLKGVNNNASSINPIKENDVISLTLKIKIVENHNLYIEKAWSNQSRGEYNQGLNEVIKSTPKALNNSAFLFKYDGSFIKTKSKIETKVRVDELFFFSLGNPSNRRDALRSQFTLKQTIYKNKINGQLSIKFEKDNISDSKSYTTALRSIQAQLNFKIRKSNLKIEGQNIITKSSFYTSNLYEIVILNGSFSKPYRLFKKQCQSVLVFNYINSRGLFTDTINKTYLTNINSTCIVSPTLSVNSSYTFSLNENTNLGKYSNQFDISLNKQIKKTSITLRYALLNIYKIEQRNTIGTGYQVQLGSKLSTSFLFNYENIIRKEMSYNNFISLNINTLYTF